MSPSVRVIAGIVIFLAYPYLVYRGIDSGLIWIAPLLVSVLYFSRAIRAGSLEVRLTNLLVAGSLIFGVFYLQSLTAKLLPVFVQLILLWLFGRTLFKGRPLVESFARLDYPDHPDFPPGIEEYCRQLTWVWTLFFGLNALLCTALALWAADSWWAFYTGFVMLVLTAVLVAAEYLYRRFKFPDLDIPSPGASLKSIVMNSRKIWLDVHAR